MVVLQFINCAEVNPPNIEDIIKDITQDSQNGGNNLETEEIPEGMKT